MKKFVIIFAIILLQLHLASAISFINVYIDESGEAEFLGETEATELDLLSGISLSNGEIRGTTSEMTNKQGELWSISYSLENSEIDLIFPKGTTIKSVENGEIYVSNEGIISVYFIDNIEITYTIEKTPEPITAPKNLLLIIVLAVILILLIFYVINYSNRDKPEPKEEVKISNLK